VIAGKAIAALQGANTPPRYYRFGDGLIRTIPGLDDSIRLQPLARDELRYELARCARWFKPSSWGERRAALPPLHVVRDILATPDIPFPVLRRVIHVPSFARDGRLITSPGFDELSGLLYQPSAGFTIRAIPQDPNASDVREAVDLLENDLFGDFPFASHGDRAGILACILLPFARDLIDGPTPLHLIEKPQPGTGATLLVDVIGEIIGRDAVVQITEAGDHDESRKRLTSGLLSGPQLVVLDNVRTLDSPALASAITTTTWKDRMLGETRIVTAPVSCTWIATGNNPRLSNEIARRTIRIRLDPRTDQPWLRTGFKHANLRTYARQRRAEIIAALLTIIAGWQNAGSRRGSATLGMFEEWAAVLGGILSVAGVPGFLENQASLYDSADAETVGWRAFVERWWDVHHSADVGVKELWPLVDNPDPIDLGLGKGDERATKTALGRRLQQCRDRQFGGFRIIAVKKRQHAQLWRLEPTPSPHHPSTISRVVSAANGAALPSATTGSTGAITASVSGEHGEPREPLAPAAQRDVRSGEIGDPGEEYAGGRQQHSSGPPSPQTATPAPSRLELNARTPSTTSGAHGTVAAPDEMLGPNVPPDSQHGSAVGDTGDGRVASVPFMITRAMERKVIDLGYPQYWIDLMSPAEANEIVATGRKFDIRYVVPGFAFTEK
jgi:putative DNA primase/helicase